MSDRTAVFPEGSRCESAQIEVVRAGMDTWLVDPGRPGFREQGWVRAVRPIGFRLIWPMVF